MDSILTPSEIDALLKSVEAPEPVRAVKPVDLVARDHRAFAVLPQLQEAAHRLALQVGRVCTQQLRIACKATADPVEVVPVSRLAALVGDPRFIYGIKVGRVSGAGVVTIDGFLGGAFVDRLFGSETSSPPVLEGPATNTEKRTVARLAGKIVEALQSVLERLNPLQAVLEHTPPPMLRSAPKNLAAVLMVVHVTFGDFRCRVTTALDTAAAGFRLLPADPVAHLDAPLRPTLLRVPVEISSVLGTAMIPVQQFLALKVGDLLTLDTPVGGEIPLLVEGRAKFLGTPAINRGNLSLQIGQQIKE